MKTRIQSLLNKTMGLLKDPSIKNPVVLAQLASLPAKLQRIDRQSDELVLDLDNIEQLLAKIEISEEADDREEAFYENRDVSGELGKRKERTRIKITIQRPMLGLSGVLEIIDEARASDSLAKFVTLLYKAKGEHVLEELTKLRINRGPFVSRNPERDYEYRSDNVKKLYSHHSISDSGYFVLTGTSSDQKVGDINRACQFLRLPSGAVRVEKIKRL